MQMVGDGLFKPPLSVVLWATSTTHTKKISAIGSREAPNQPHAAPLASSVGEQQTSAIAENTDDEVKGNQRKHFDSRTVMNTLSSALACQKFESWRSIATQEHLPTSF